jgi:hypothetical protein
MFGANPLTSPYEMGAIARAAGRPITENPYRSAVDRQHFERGWRSEDRDIRGEEASRV